MNISEYNDIDIARVVQALHENCSDIDSPCLMEAILQSGGQPSEGETATEFARRVGSFARKPQDEDHPIFTFGSLSIIRL